MRFSKSDAQSMRREIKEAMAAIEKKYDCELKIGNISYGATLSAKLEFAKMSSNEHGDFALTKEAQAFITKAKGLGLKQEILGEALVYRGSTYVITGFNSRRSKYPMSYTKDGRNYKSDVSFITSIVKETYPEFFI